MASYVWERLMREWNEFVFSIELQDLIDYDIAAKRWLGNPPAIDSQIAELESRLRLALPPSYRAFLQFSNGWNGTEETHIVPTLLPASEVDLFSRLSPDELESWRILIVNPISPKEFRKRASNPDNQEFPLEYLQNAIQVSEPIDNVYILLIPDMVEEGEFEVWKISAWLNGPLRYPSFWKFMQHQYQQCVAVYSED